MTSDGGDSASCAVAPRSRGWPHKVEGSPTLGDEGSVTGMAPACKHQTRLPDCPGPHICWGRLAETLHRASGLGTALNHLFQIQDQLISDPQMGLFMCFSPTSLLHINAWTGPLLNRCSGKPDIVFISLLEEQGKRRHEGTALCGFSDISTANMQCPENPVPQSMLHKLSCTETHTPQPSLYRKQILKRRNLLLGALLVQTAAANASQPLQQRAAAGWKCAHRHEVHPVALAFRIRMISKVCIDNSADIRKNDEGRP